MSSEENSGLPTEGKSEWDIFERLEELEKAVGEVRDVNLRDVYVLASWALFYCFLSLAGNFPRSARRQKDILISALKKQGVNTKVVENIESDLIKICERAEKELS